MYHLHHIHLLLLVCFQLDPSPHAKHAQANARLQICMHTQVYAYINAMLAEVEWEEQQAYLVCKALGQACTARRSTRYALR